MATGSFSVAITQLLLDILLMPWFRNSPKINKLVYLYADINLKLYLNSDFKMFWSIKITNSEDCAALIYVYTLVQAL